MITKTQMNNDEAVLHYIRRYGPISKAIIARQTGITPPTVTNVTNHLMRKGLVYEDRREKAPLGRPSMLLQFKRELETILVIHVRTLKVTFHVVDAIQTVLAEKELSSVGLNADEIMQNIYRGAEECIEEFEGKISSIGMVMRGPVDSEKGISVSSPHAKWSNIPFKYILEEKFHLPVYMENDMRALATGEYYYGRGQGIQNLLVVKFSYGLGAAIVYRGQLYRGFTDTAGELGHMLTLDDDGKYVQVESVASETALRERVLSRIAKGAKTGLAKNAQVCGENFCAEPIYEAALNGDEVASEALQFVGRHLGIALTNINNLVNPERIVLSCAFGDAVGLIDPVIRNILDAHGSRTYPVEISYAGSGSEYILKGMVDIVCERRAGSAWL